MPNASVLSRAHYLEFELIYSQGGDYDIFSGDPKLSRNMLEAILIGNLRVLITFHIFMDFSAQS
jgi:hypothetical protein